MKQNKIIGITGGVGAGKSTVLDYIRTHYDVEIIQADEVGHDLMEPGESVYFALIDEYGPEILNEDRTINRAEVAVRAFRTEETQARINEIEHPLIKAEIEKRIEASDKDVIFIEAALFVEGKLTDISDELWVVQAKESVRVKRLMQSRGYTKEKCRSIIEKQLSEKEYLSYADVIIQNDGDFEVTGAKIDQEMKRLGS